MKLKIKDNKFIPGKEFLLFLFFFLISCSLWLMMTLNKYYETDIEIPLRVKKIPEDIHAVSMEKEIISIKIKDRGTVLFNYKTRNFLPITIDYNDFQKQNGKLTLPTTSLKKELTGQLATSTEILSFTPDSITYYTQTSSQKFPVEISGQISSATQYEIGDITINPDSVWVFGPESATDTMIFVYTEAIEKTELRDSVSLTVNLQEKNGVKYSTNQVDIRIPVTPYTEKSFEIDIKGMGFPASYNLKALPSKAKVLFNVNVVQIDSVKASDFAIGIMYGDIHGNKSERAKLTLIKHPDNVRNIRIIPNEVEYIIEHQ